jgi:hypothetical protein
MEKEHKFLIDKHHNADGHTSSNQGKKKERAKVIGPITMN